MPASFVNLLIVIPIVWLFLTCLMLVNHNPSTFNMKEYENAKSRLEFKPEKIEMFESYLNKGTVQTSTSNNKHTSSLTILNHIIAPGEFGTPVHINVSMLNEIERKKFDEGWSNHSFNRYASDMISVRRSLLDIRDPL
jgi:hypothetical protein